MKHLEKETLKFASIRSNWDRTVGSTGGMYVYHVHWEDKEVIDGDHYLAVCEYIETEFKKDFQLQEGQNVMFEERLIFPRKKFRQHFPKNKVVFSIDEADVYIMDTNKFERNTVEKWRVSSISAVEKDPMKGWRTGFWYHNLPASEIPADTGETRKILNMSEHELEVKKTYMNGMLTILEKGVRIMDFRSVKFSTENSMDLEAFQRVQRMFSGGAEMVSLAMAMLTAYDFASESLHMALLLHGTAINNWKWEREKKSNVEIRNFIKQMESVHPEIWWSQGSKDAIRWYLELLLKHPDDEIVQKAANQHLRRSLGSDMPDLNITLKINEKEKSNPLEHPAAGAA